MKDRQWCLIGFPDDEGVKNVGGRIGASKGPAAFRKHFAKIKGRYDVHSSLSDLESIPFRMQNLTDKHDQAIDTIVSQQPLHDFTLVIGGGHDYIYCHLKGIKETFPGKTIGCINIDPHFDMRAPEPVFSSGSPFHVTLEEGIIKGSNLVSFGIQPHANAPALWEFAEKHQVQTVLFEDLWDQQTSTAFDESLKKLKEECDLIVVSFDLDSVAAPFAPGVSAPAVEGFTPTEALRMMRSAGAHEKVVSLGIYELNPNYDQDERTAKLAAAGAYYFAAAKLYDEV